jgi:hypothetical protein
MHLSIISPLATALVSIESLTANITTDTAQDFVGVLGLKNIVHGPGPLGALLNNFTGVVCSDTDGKFYNSSLGENSTRLQILQKQD